MDKEFESARELNKYIELCLNLRTRLKEFADIYKSLWKDEIEAKRKTDDEADRFARGIFPDNVYLAELYLHNFYEEIKV